jgi:hypothetical protein
MKRSLWFLITLSSLILAACGNGNAVSSNSSASESSSAANSESSSFFSSSPKSDSSSGASSSSSSEASSTTNPKPDNGVLNYFTLGMTPIIGGTKVKKLADGVILYVKSNQSLKALEASYDEPSQNYVVIFNHGLAYRYGIDLSFFLGTDQGFNESYQGTIDSKTTYHADLTNETVTLSLSPVFAAQPSFENTTSVTFAMQALGSEGQLFRLNAANYYNVRYRLTDGDTTFFECALVWNAEQALFVGTLKYLPIGKTLFVTVFAANYCCLANSSYQGSFDSASGATSYESAITANLAINKMVYFSAQPDPYKSRPNGDVQAKFVLHCEKTMADYVSLVISWSVTTIERIQMNETELGVYEVNVGMDPVSFTFYFLSHLNSEALIGQASGDFSYVGVKDTAPTLTVTGTFASGTDGVLIVS